MLTYPPRLVFHRIIQNYCIYFKNFFYQKFCAKEFDSKLAPISISSFITLVEKSATFSEFSANFDRLFVDKLLRDKTDEYVDSVNFAK
ncbi:hypothetical protein [Helicobacter sp. MIT 01-3238]|uniref:hypothetical protein n=1 Tax=Helicobacter sp. MIT 01-3238 TaxID=398627 RepID=UPI000E1EA668|nr:hypothetical protein [Helicobacter sp. MIT 01-3238]RDU52178.1 hypothetical protein CQA40_08070 [Helicobacter sp. MIT 01-3238]